MANEHDPLDLGLEPTPNAPPAPAAPVVAPPALPKALRYMLDVPFTCSFIYGSLKKGDKVTGNEEAIKRLFGLPGFEPVDS